MHISLNGTERTVADGTFIGDLIVELTGESDPKGIAVALDRGVVPRSEWGTTVVCSGSVLEIVTATAGG
jgi:sulfur carrier protein